MGGAYGGFCRLSASSGVFTYLSYRDPNLKGTLDNYDNAASHLSTLELSDGDLSQSIIGAVGEIDRPMQADQKGFASLSQYLAGETAADRQARRDELLSTTLADFRAFGDRLHLLNKESTVTVIGSKGSIDKANEDMGAHPRLNVRELM
ncbi:Metalloenzyme, LuxS/M16 peptidase-like protein [Pavlovales sp. CCMP2436]|nr:Metalloenzyme, LuxS/M16 peptidase-like protein [Pavlovales sp. CCMP2436]